MSLVIDDFLADMRRVRPSGAISPLQTDVAEMGRSINPQGKPKAVSLPYGGRGDDLIGYGSEGASSRASTEVTPPSGGTPVKYPEYPDISFPDMPQHTQYPALPGDWQSPALPRRISINDYPAYPDIPSGGPLRDILPYANIGRTALGVAAIGANAFGYPNAANVMNKIGNVVGPIIGAANIYNAWNNDFMSKKDKIRTTVREGVSMTPQILNDFGDVMVGVGAESVGGWGHALAGAVTDNMGYVNLGMSAFDLLTAEKGERGRAAYNTAMSAMSIANPYFGAVNAVGQAVFGGINMYKQSRDERQQWTWPMHESALRADIKYALDRGQTVDINDVIGRLKQLGMKDDDINTYLDKTNFYAPLAADTNNGVWGGAWEDWRTNKDIILSAGDMTGIEGGASIRDVIMNQTGIKPITNNPNAYTRMVQQRNPNPVYDEVNFQIISDPYINVAETGFRKPIEWVDPFSMPLTDVGT